MNPKLPLAKRYTWMLRADVRGEADAQAAFSERFAQWWLIKGRSEYPYWSQLSKEEQAWLFEASGKLSIENVEIAIPRAMQLTLAWRPDVIQKFTVNEKTNSELIAAWFFAIGMGEHFLGDAASIELIRTLDKPLLHLTSPNKVADEAPAVTLLMYMAWTLLSPEMQQAMDIKVSSTRNRFISWFFTVGINVFKCKDLIANRWRSWLLEPISMGEGLGELPRFALYEYAFLPAKQRPDLKDPKTVTLWRAWSQKALEPSVASGSTAGAASALSRWSWIKTAGKIKPYEPSVPATPISTKPFGVNLFGFAYGELGLGEDLRMAVETCKAAKVPYRIVNIEPGVEIRQNDKGVEKDVLASGGLAPYAINVFCMPGFDTVSRIFLKLGDHVFDGHYNIGWWPWEMGVWPKVWNSAFDLVDEVWACSEHSFNMYEKSTKKPVIAMPLAASVARAKTYSRKHFGLPEKKGLFLYAFDFNSHLVRKNPMAVIHAFEQQFIGNKNVCLVLKVMNAKPKDPDWLAFCKQIAKDARIILIDRTLDRPEVLGLIQACDVYVSPHRAEGFGRTLAEAMLLGKPVVATNYSGNQYFMNPDHTFPVDYELVPAKKGEYHFIEDGDEAVWANVSIAHLGAQMQAALLASKQASFKKQLLAYAHSVFAPERTALLMAERLEWIKAHLVARSVAQ